MNRVPRRRSSITRLLVGEKASGLAVEDGLAFVASTAQRLAVLLRAGVPAHSAWLYLDGEVGLIVTDMVEGIDAGKAIPSMIVDQLGTIQAGSDPIAEPEVDAWRSLAAAWQVATTTGTPLAPALQAIAQAIRAVSAARSELRVSVTGSVATAKIVMILPAVAVVFGVLLGFDPIRTLVTTPLGLVCLVAGLLLMLVAARWNRRLIARAERHETNPGLLGELTAIAVSGGSSVTGARASVDVAVHDCLISVSALDKAAVDRTIELSMRAGVPASELLRAEAEESRRIARTRATGQATVLSVQVMMPLGLCILPAFMLLGVAPLMLSLMSSTVTGF